MSHNLLALTHEIIHLCDALLKNDDSPLDEKQRQWVEVIRDCADDRPGSDNASAGLLNTFNWYVAQYESAEQIQSAQRELLFSVPTPIAIIRTKVHLLLQSGKYRESIQQIQRCIEQIESELDSIRRKTN